jgi:hypothetical protein
MRNSIAVVGLALGIAAGGQEPKPAIQNLAEIFRARAETPIETERASNQKTFDERYLAAKEILFDKSAGHWLAIAGGELLPSDAKGNPLPSPTLEPVLRLLAERHPNAKQRFIFRVGEEGDLQYHMTVCDRPEFVGANFINLLGNVWMTPNGTYRMPHAGPFGKEAVLLGQTSDAKDISAEVGAPKLANSPATPNATKPADNTNKTIALDFVAANIYGGTAVISASNATKIGLELWEIPGKVISAGRADMRRARASIRVPAIQFDQSLTIAVADR